MKFFQGKKIYPILVFLGICSAIVLLAFYGVREIPAKYLKESLAPLKMSDAFGASNLRVAYLTNTSIQEMKLDPALVNTSQEANLIRNLYDRLFEFDSEGSLRPALAEEFYWNGNDIHIKIRKNVKTIDGYLITAEDVSFSFKRLMILGKHTHGDLKSFLCPKHKFSSIQDECPGIRVENGELILTAEQPYKNKFLISLLASMDFSILPMKSVNINSAKLEIIDYRNTSGPFFLEKDDAKGNFLFSINSNHYKATKDIPQKIQFVAATQKNMVDLLKSGAVDLLTTVAPILSQEQMNEFRNARDFSFHETLHIKNYFINFFKKKDLNFTPEQRRFLGKEIKKKYLSAFAEDGLEETQEIFPAFSEGSLDDSTAGELKKIIESSLMDQKIRKANFAVTDGNSDKYKTFLNDFSGINVVNYESLGKALLLSEKDSPDIATGYVDASFYESVSLISYNINSGKFDMSREEGIQWLEDYMKIEDKAERLKKFRQLHFEALKKAYMVPMGLGPYTAVVRKPWRFEMPKLYAGTPMWLIKRD